MPWDNEGSDLSEFASGYRCGFCESIGPCSHGIEGRPSEVDSFDEQGSFDDLPEPNCWTCGDIGCDFCRGDE